MISPITTRRREKIRQREGKIEETYGKLIVISKWKRRRNKKKRITRKNDGWIIETLRRVEEEIRGNQRVWEIEEVQIGRI